MSAVVPSRSGRSATGVRPQRLLAAPGSAGIVLVVVLVTGWAARTGVVSHWSDAVPMTWLPPPASALLLLPGAVVAGLLAARVVLDEARLLVHAARWATGWAVACALWTAFGVVDLYDGLSRLAQADNVVEVMAADPATTARLACLAAAVLVVAVTRPASTPASTPGSCAALVALVLVAVLGALTLAPPGAVHGHGGVSADPWVAVAALVQAAGLVTWLGCTAALLGAGGGPVRRRAAVLRTGRVTTAAVAATGLATVAAGLLLPTGATPPTMAALQVWLVVALARVGSRHRSRVAAVVALGSTRAALAVLAGEGLVGLGVVALSALAPLG